MPAPSAETLAARRGAAFLIEHNGPDAIRNLDAKYLDVYSPVDCPIGQTYGGWTQGPFCPDRLTDSGGIQSKLAEARTLGFMPVPLSLASVDRLNRAWKRIIRKAQQESSEHAA